MPALCLGDRANAGVDVVVVVIVVVAGRGNHWAFSGPDVSDAVFRDVDVLLASSMLF